KGKSAEEAIALLEHLPKGSALPIGRVVRSAVANAENNFNMTMENLYVKRATSDEGPRMKRVWYRGRGRRDLKVRRTVHITIGKGGTKVEELRQVLGKTTGKAVKVNIFEIRFPEVDANLIAENVAQQLERRVSFRKVLKQTVQRAMKSGAKGVRVAVAGRLGGAEMSRREWARA